jgi:excisionase family DNA binding protein
MAALPGGVEIFTVDEVAEILRLNRRTVLNLLQNGELVGFRAGRQWRIKREELERFTEQQGGSKGIDDSTG